MTEDGQPKTLAEARRMIAALRKQNHDAAAARDQRNKKMERDLARVRSDFEFARSFVKDDFYDHFWKHASFASKYRLVDLLAQARKLDIDRLTHAIDQHFDFCLNSHRDPAGMTEFAQAIADAYETD